MSLDRNAILDALIARIATITSEGVPVFRTATRRAKIADQIPAQGQPAAVLICAGQANEALRHRPPKVRLDCELYVYAQGAGTAGPGPALHDCVGAIESTLVMQPGEARASAEFDSYSTTLGGLVSSVQVRSIEFNEGLESQAEAKLVLEIVTTA